MNDPRDDPKRARPEFDEAAVYKRSLEECQGKLAELRTSIKSAAITAKRLSASLALLSCEAEEMADKLSN